MKLPSAMSAAVIESLRISAEPTEPSAISSEPTASVPSSLEPTAPAAISSASTARGADLAGADRVGAGEVCR